MMIIIIIMQLMKGRRPSDHAALVSQNRNRHNAKIEHVRISYK